jgi:hypothetical protein
MRFSKTLSAFLMLVAVLALAAVPALASNGKGPVGPPGGLVYAHDVAYRTVGTPTDLPDQGDFNTIYLMGNGLGNVSESAPGDMNWRGGRWEVRPITWVNIAPTQFTNAEQVHAAAMAGDITIGDVVKRFECPLIRAQD